jgi:hypothetical protein
MKREEIIKSWMENYPEASAGNCMRCVNWNYEKMGFEFFDEEEEKHYKLDMDLLQKGFKKLLELVEEGKYRNSMGQIPNFLAVGYEDDSQDHDDLVQCALLGDVIYG